MPSSICRNTDTKSFPPSTPKHLLNDVKSTSGGTTWKHSIFFRNHGWQKVTPTVVCLPHTSPTSAPSFSCFISITHTPVSSFPSASVFCIGAGPRYNGSNDGCTFKRREGANECRRRDGMNRPNDAVTIQ